MRITIVDLQYNGKRRDYLTSYELCDSFSPFLALPTKVNGSLSENDFQANFSCPSPKTKQEFTCALLEIIIPVMFVISCSLDHALSQIFGLGIQK